MMYMGAQYFFGTRQGKAKSTGNDYWVVQVLRVNRFKSWELAQCFVDEDFYKHVNSMGLPLGVAVTLSGDVVDGQIVDIQVDSRFVPLNLNQAASPSYATTKK